MPEHGDGAAVRQPLLDGAIGLEGAVPVHMVVADVEEDADIWRERRRKVDLEGRDLEHRNLRRRVEVERGAADVAGHLRLLAHRLEEVGEERRRRRLAVGAGDRDEPHARQARPALAVEHLDVADDRDAGRVRPRRRPVRLGVRQRHARREEERVEAGKVRRREIARREARRRGRRDPLGLVVGAQHMRAAGDERLRGGKARPAEAEHGDTLAAEGLGGDHLSFSVERPRRASTKAMIQKRITTCGSVQPICSKWWWMGAMRKTRLPVSL